MDGNLRFKINWASLLVGRKFTRPFLLCFTLYLRAISKYKPLGGLYLKGRFNGGFLALGVWGAYIWRGLFMEALIFGILRYFNCKAGTTEQRGTFNVAKYIRLEQIVFFRASAVLEN